MRHDLKTAIQQFWLDESGQSIAEYGAIIGFVGVCIALAFNLANNGFFAGVSQSFSVTSSSLDQMNGLGASSGSSS